MKRSRFGCLLAAAFLAAATVAAQEPSPLTLGLFSSFSVSHNLNDPSDDRNTLRVYDTREGEVSFDVVEAVIRRTAASPGDVGFRFDLIAGSALPHVTAARGLFRDPSTGEAEDFDLLQAHVSYVAPVGRGLRFDLGKQTALIGYEGVEGVDGWNDTISRSFLLYAGPTTHTGLRVSTSLSDAVSGVLYVVSGWDVVEDNNDSPSLGLQLGVARPGSPFTVSFNYLGGAEKSGDDSDLRHALDVVSKLSLSSRTTLGVELFAGHEEGSAADGGSARWTGAALYLRTDPTPRVALTLRVETLDDPDGNRTGSAQRLAEGTFAAQYEVAEGLFLRAEARYDHSDTEVFAGNDDLERGQPTVALNVVWSDSDLLDP